MKMDGYLESVLPKPDCEAKALAERCLGTTGLWSAKRTKASCGGGTSHDVGQGVYLVQRPRNVSNSG